LELRFTYAPAHAHVGANFANFQLEQPSESYAFLEEPAKSKMTVSHRRKAAPKATRPTRRDLLAWRLLHSVPAPPRVCTR